MRVRAGVMRRRAGQQRGVEEEMGREGGFLCICGPQAVRPKARVAPFPAPRAPRKYQGKESVLWLGDSKGLHRLVIPGGLRKLGVSPPWPPSVGCLTRPRRLLSSH